MLGVLLALPCQWVLRKIVWKWSCVSPSSSMRSVKSEPGRGVGGVHRVDAGLVERDGVEGCEHADILHDRRVVFQRGSRSRAKRP